MANLWRAALGKEQDLTRDEVVDILFWFKMIFALLFGVGAGLLEAAGIYVVLSFIVLLVLANFLYYSRVLGTMDEEYKHQEIFMEAFPNTLAMFIVYI